MKVDELGLAIIALLQQEPRMANKDVADRLDISEATVAARIKDLEARKVLRIIMQRNLRAMGADLFVLLDIHILGRPAEDVAAELATIEEAVSVSTLLSEPDILLRLNVRDRRHLLHVIETKVAPVQGISHWSADIALELVKLDQRYGTLDTDL